MAKLFSKRNKSQEDKLRYDVPEVVRSRILAAFKDLCCERLGGFLGLLDNVGDFLYKEYGSLRQSSYVGARRSDNQSIEHFYCCSDEQALDFIEACFEQEMYDGKQEGVEDINDIFREHNIGYELTPFIEYTVEKEISLFGNKRPGKVIKYEYPKIIRIDNKLVYKEIIEPSLELLSDSRFKVVNAEMLKAHTALRLGNCEDAITNTGSAFESFLKTILKLKRIKYDSDRDEKRKRVKSAYDLTDIILRLQSFIRLAIGSLGQTNTYKITLSNPVLF